MRKVCGPSCFFKLHGSKYKETQVLYNHFSCYVVLPGGKKERKKVPHEYDMIIIIKITMKVLFIVAHCWIFFLEVCVYVILLRKKINSAHQLCPLNFV